MKIKWYKILIAVVALFGVTVGSNLLGIGIGNWIMEDLK